MKEVVAEMKSRAVEKVVENKEKKVN